MTEPDLYCDNCGRRCDGGESYCTGCGTSLFQTSTPVAATVEGWEVPWTPVHVTIGLMLFLVLLIAAAFVARGAGSLYPAHEQALQTWIGVHLLALAAGVVVWFLGARMAVSPARALGFVAPRTSLGMSSLLALAALAASILGTFAYGLAVDALGMEFLRPPEIEDGTIFPGCWHPAHPASPGGCYSLERRVAVSRLCAARDDSQHRARAGGGLPRHCCSASFT